MTPEAYFLRNLPLARRVVIAFNDEHLSALKNDMRPMRVMLDYNGTIRNVLDKPALPEAERAADASRSLIRGLTAYMQGDDAVAAASVRRVLDLLDERAAQNVAKLAVRS